MRNINNKIYWVACNEAETDIVTLETLAKTKYECIGNLCTLMGEIQGGGWNYKADGWEFHKVFLTVIKTK